MHAQTSLCLSAVLAAALAFPASARADGPRKVDFTAPVVVDGKPVIDDIKCPFDKDNKHTCDTPFTVGELSFLSLEHFQDHQSWADAIKHDDLARAIRMARDFPLLDDQKIEIEQAAGPLWSPGILGAIRDVIDPRPAAPAAPAP